MLTGKNLRSIVDYPKLYEVFPGVKIRGGVSAFLWDSDHQGPCAVQTMWDGAPTGPIVERYLDAYDVLVRRNEAVPIVEKITSFGEPTLDRRVSSAKPFGLRTFFHGKDNARGMKNPVKLFGSQKVTWIERDNIKVNLDWIDKWKVLMTAVQGTSAAIETKFLSIPIVAGPGTACTETYLVAGVFSSEAEARNYASYLRTRFVRFLVSLRKTTQHATRDVYGFVPDLSFDNAWTDGALFARYELTRDQIDFIESQVAAHAESKPMKGEGDVSTGE